MHATTRLQTIPQLGRDFRKWTRTAAVIAWVRFAMLVGHTHLRNRCAAPRAIVRLSATSVSRFHRGPPIRDAYELLLDRADLLQTNWVQYGVDVLHSAANLPVRSAGFQ